MKITAICNTYRRPELLEEALQSFLMQDYAGDKELIILNDEPEQELIFKHPQVRVINMPSRAPDLAIKHNFAVSIATGDIITPWDDDDIFLPSRLTDIAKAQKSGIWFSDLLFTDTSDGMLNLTKGEIHCNHAYSQKAFMRFGAYHDTAGKSFDFVMMNAIRSSDINVADEAKPSYIYRKNTTSSLNYSNSYSKTPEQTMEKYADGNADFVKGQIKLDPHWSVDWQGLVDEALSGNSEAIPLHEVDSSYIVQNLETT